MNLKQRNGFTLIELMVTIIISGIIVAIAVPNMGRIVAQQRVQNRIDQLWALLQFSKAEAMRINKPVIICTTTVAANIAQSNGCQAWKTDDRQQGLLAFSDDNMDQQYSANIDTLLRSVLFIQNRNGAEEVQVNTIAEACTTVSQCTKLNGLNKLIFMPDGRFGWGDADNGWALGQVFIRLTISDAKQPQQIQRRIVVTPGGKAIACPVSTTTSQLAYCKTSS